MKPHRFVAKQDVLEMFVKELVSVDNIEKAKVSLRRKYKIQPSNANILFTYKRMIEDGILEEDITFLQKCKGHSNRENSGVIVVSLLMSPHPNGQPFSCKFDCTYCPNEPSQPRSYLQNEPGVLRANRNGFSASAQIHDRLSAYAVNGLATDKIEIIIQGGTFSSYPESYIRQFFLDIFSAANSFSNSFGNKNVEDIENILEEKKLRKEQIRNEKSKARIIGITIETRPDQINEQQLKLFRELGVTRVQLGVQHTDDKILKGVNRQCSTRHTIKAIRILKDNCFKIDIHLMPDLPGASPEIDRIMFDNVLQNPDLQVDQWKIYPCTIVPWTKIEQQFRDGTYVPYGFSALKELLIYVKTAVHPWIRLNRIIRDIPSTYFVNDSGMKTNMRQLLQDEMTSRGLKCRCIRCREVKNGHVTGFELKIRKYPASLGQEYFISYEHEDKIFGFCRLRIIDFDCNGKNKNQKQNKKQIFPELEGLGLVRELHVYGKVVGQVQHKGLGTQLLEEAEKIAESHDLNGTAVISGVGVREYYRKRGYTLIEPYGYMIKRFRKLNPPEEKMPSDFILTLLIILIIVGVTFALTQIRDPLLCATGGFVFFFSLILIIQN